MKRTLLLAWCGVCFEPSARRAAILANFQGLPPQRFHMLWPVLLGCAPDSGWTIYHPTHSLNGAIRSHGKEVMGYGTHTQTGRTRSCLSKVLRSAITVSSSSSSIVMTARQQNIIISIIVVSIYFISFLLYFSDFLEQPTTR